MAAHAVGNEKQVRSILADLQLRFGQAGLPHAHPLAELSDQELILVRFAHLAGVGNAKGLHGKRGWQRRRDGIFD